MSLTPDIRGAPPCWSSYRPLLALLLLLLGFTDGLHESHEAITSFIAALSTLLRTGAAVGWQDSQGTAICHVRCIHRALGDAFRPRSSERPDKACSALADAPPLCWSHGAGCVPLHVALLLTGGPPRTQVLIDCVLTPQVHARPPDYKYLAVRPHRAPPLLAHLSHTYPAHNLGASSC